MRLTSPSRECRFRNSSDSNFSLWLGTTRGILKRNLGLGGTSAWGGWGGWGTVWWWEGAWLNMSPWWEVGGCWGGCPKGNMLKGWGAALWSMVVTETRTTTTVWWWWWS